MYLVISRYKRDSDVVFRKPTAFIMEDYKKHVDLWKQVNFNKYPNDSENIGEFIMDIYTLEGAGYAPFMYKQIHEKAEPLKTRKVINQPKVG